MSRAKRPGFSPCRVWWRQLLSPVGPARLRAGQAPPAADRRASSALDRAPTTATIAPPTPHVPITASAPKFQPAPARNGLNWSAGRRAGVARGRPSRPRPSTLASSSRSSSSLIRTRPLRPSDRSRLGRPEPRARGRRPPDPAPPVRRSPRPSVTSVAASVGHWIWTPYWTTPSASINSTATAASSVAAPNGPAT